MGENTARTPAFSQHSPCPCLYTLQAALGTVSEPHVPIIDGCSRGLLVIVRQHNHLQHRLPLHIALR